MKNKSTTNLGRIGKVWSYTIIVETEHPQDLEDILNKEFQKLAGHRNRIVFYRADGFPGLSKALQERYQIKPKVKRT